MRPQIFDNVSFSLYQSASNQMSDSVFQVLLKVGFDVKGSANVLTRKVEKADTVIVHYHEYDGGKKINSRAIGIQPRDYELNKTESVFTRKFEFRTLPLTNRIEIFLQSNQQYNKRKTTDINIKLEEFKLFQFREERL
ncbi:MAG: hypothetical protein GY710_12240 [Desulfobacteraceae bacterium]|nr:hypothetical protein [Desulfobacteraceae bacterium]